MRRTFAIGGLFFVLIVTGCGSDELSRKAHEVRSEELRLEGEREKELLGRLDEFKSMTAPVKLQNPYLVSDALILIKRPGRDFEIYDKESVKGGVVKSLVRADCDLGRKLMDLELNVTAVGPLHATVCKMTVIDLETKTTVASSELILDKPKMRADETIDPDSLDESVDKKSHFIRPYAGVRNYVLNLGNTNPKK